MDVLEEDDADDVFAYLVGKTLAAVTFVWNYYQLLIDTETLSIYAAPTVSDRDGASRQGNPGYRDALCARIGAKIVRARSDDSHVEFEFSDGAIIAVSFKPEDRVARELKESLMVTNPNGSIMVVGDSGNAYVENAVGVSRIKRPSSS